MSQQDEQNWHGPTEVEQAAQTEPGTVNEDGALRDLSPERSDEQAEDAPAADEE